MAFPAGEQPGSVDVYHSGLTPRGVPLLWRWLVPVTVTASVAAWITAVSSGQVHGAARVLLIVAGALFTATAAGVPLWQQGRTARARADAVATAQSARAEMRIAIEDALEPFTALLLQLATARGHERSRLRGEAIQLALTSIAQLTSFTRPDGVDGPRRIRVILFRLEQDEHRRLVPDAFAGRSGAPTVSFDDSTRIGQAMLRSADDGWIVIPDVTLLNSVPWWDDEHLYATYATGPVPGAAGGAIGMLTLDALNPGELAGLDLPLIRLIAHLLSLALQI